MCDTPIDAGEPVQKPEYHHSWSSFTDKFKHHSPSTTPNPEAKKESSTPTSPDPGALASPAPRRMVILLVGLKPHRKIWTSSSRPGESVINYVLLNGTPAIVVPVKTGAPLVAWDSLTLEQLWAVELPPEGSEPSSNTKFEGITQVLTEFIELCVDWDRMSIEGDQKQKREAIHAALSLLVAASIRSKSSSEAKKEVDPERAGIAMWRIP